MAAVAGVKLVVAVVAEVLVVEPAAAAAAVATPGLEQAHNDKDAKVPDEEEETTVLSLQ